MKIKNIHIRFKNNFNLFDKNIFFLHIPKCGGRSIEEGIENLYKTLNIRNDRNIVRQDSRRSAKIAELFYNYNYKNGDVNDYFVQKFNQNHLAYLMYNNNYRFISGHTAFNDLIYEQFKDSYYFVTLLRDPVKKWLSNYYYRKYRKSDHWNIQEDIQKYLLSERGKSHGYDYIKYFGGIREDNNYHSKDSFELSKINLSKFHVVGLLENVPKFQSDFENIIGARIMIGKKNITQRHNNREITKDIIKQITTICSPDIEIYNYVKSKIHK